MALELHPLDTGELIDRTVSLYREHFLIFTGIVALPQLAVLLVNLGVIGARSPLGSVSQILLGLVAQVVTLLAYTVAQGATVAAVSDVYLEQPAGIGKAYADSKGRLVSVLVASLFVGVGVCFGFFLLIVPGVIWLTAWSLTIPAVVVEKMTPVEAMKRSWELTRKSRGRILLAMILVGILTFIISMIFQLPGTLMAGIAGIRNPAAAQTLPLIVLQIGSVIATCLATPLGTIALSLIYYDQRVRKEGFDLQLMLASLEPKNPNEPER